MKKELLFVGGARPNFMKLAPIFWELKSKNLLKQSKLIHTGQHYDPKLSDVFFKELDLPTPYRHLEVGSDRHGAQTAKILERFESVLLEQESEIAGVVVVGDVNSTVAAALAAKKLNIQVAHVEAGLRSFDRTMPEEINRLATDAISDLLLVSEPTGLVNLKNEGYKEDSVVYTGNVMIDSLAKSINGLNTLNICKELNVDANANYFVVTMHRPSNVDEKRPCTIVVETLLELAKTHKLVFPVHPRTKARLTSFGLIGQIENNKNIELMDPIGYKEMISLIKHASGVLTDSGGIQEETTYLGVPCYTWRPNTERPITITQGTNVLLGDEPSQAQKTLFEHIGKAQPSKNCSIEGWDGNAAKRIVSTLVERWGL